MHKKLVTFLGCYAPIVRSHDTATRPINGFTMNLKPLTNLMKPFHGFYRQFTVRTRTYIEKQVGIFTGGCDKFLNEIISASF